MRVLFAIALNVIGLVAVVAGMWPVAAAVYIVQPARILWHAGGYRPASFFVQEIEFFGRRIGQASARARPTARWMARKSPSNHTSS